MYAGFNLTLTIESSRFYRLGIFGLSVICIFWILQLPIHWIIQVVSSLLLSLWMLYLIIPGYPMGMPCVLWYSSYQWGLHIANQTMLFDSFQLVFQSGIFILCKAQFQKSVLYITIFRDQLDDENYRELMWAFLDSTHINN